MATIKAIETVYNGYRFRSRLEARWAVFFDTLEVKYEYEKEGFDLGDGYWYLPDFWLPDHHKWVEIKPERPSFDEREKAWRLSIQTNYNTFIFCGEPYAEREFVELEDGIGFYQPKRKYSTIGFFGDVFDSMLSGSFLDMTNGVHWMKQLYDFLYFIKEEYGEIFSKPLLPKYLISTEALLEIIERDKEYFKFKHNSIHPRYRPGNTSDEIAWQIHPKGRYPYLDHSTGGSGDILHPLLIDAYTAARQARF